MKAQQPMRLSVRATVYHGQDGYLLYGGGRGIYGTKIFCCTRAEAERIKADIKAGREVRFDSEGAA
jgi:hypothetical protein